MSTEHWQKTSDGLKRQKKKKSPCNWVGEKSKQARQELGWDVYHWAGAIKEERLLQPGTPPHWQGGQPGWKGSLTASEESAAACSWQPEQRENCTDGQYHQALPSLTCRSTGAGSGGCWNSGFRHQKWGEAGIQCDYTWGCMTISPWQVDTGRG